MDEIICDGPLSHARRARVRDAAQCSVVARTPGKPVRVSPATIASD
ncbi:hypothetical protein [Burkholderia metallica]|nr:hypothetical protein [Burkholderia metallica]MCA8020236.1 hypothetical protein [Burkholderia metallica]